MLRPVSQRYILQTLAFESRKMLGVTRNVGTNLPSSPYNGLQWPTQHAAPSARQSHAAHHRPPPLDNAAARAQIHKALDDRHAQRCRNRPTCSFPNPPRKSNYKKPSRSPLDEAGGPGRVEHDRHSLSAVLNQGLYR